MAQENQKPQDNELAPLEDAGVVEVVHAEETTVTGTIVVGGCPMCGGNTMTIRNVTACMLPDCTYIVRA